MHHHKPKLGMDLINDCIVNIRKLSMKFVIAEMLRKMAPGRFHCDSHDGPWYCERIASIACNCIASWGATTGWTEQKYLGLCRDVWGMEFEPPISGKISSYWSAYQSPVGWQMFFQQPLLQIDGTVGKFRGTYAFHSLCFTSFLLWKINDGRGAVAYLFIVVSHTTPKRDPGSIKIIGSLW